MQKYEKSLIDRLKNIATVQKYYGELEHPSTAQFIQNDLPLIYVDFLGEDTNNNFTIELKFSLYIVHLSYSKHKDNRTKKHYELYDLITDIRESLFQKSILDSSPILLKKLSKIYDAVGANGYLTIYKRDLTFIIPNNIHEEDLS
jgi:phage gp37-like protein